MPAICGVLAPAAEPVAEAPPSAPALHEGTLANGLRYVFLPHASAQGGTSLRLLVQAGSLDERDDERGFAHFVEHMAFNGTRLYPQETLLGVLQKFGMAVGADTNAFTALDHTVYKLEMPIAHTGRLVEGLHVMRDFADGLAFDAGEVAREKGVIESERVARNSGPARAGEALRKFIFPGNRLSERPPIGLPEIIRDATPEKLRAFYEKWYRADNMLLVVTGDFDPADTEKLLRESFESLATPTVPLSRIDVSIPANPPQIVAGFHNENADKGAVSIQLISLSPYVGGYKREHRLKAIARNVAFSSLSMRLESARLKEQKKFGVVSVRYENSGTLYRSAVFRVDANGRRWRDAVTRAEQELRRAQAFGFLPSEIAETAANQLASAELAVRSAATRKSAYFADRLVDSVLNRWVFMTPEADLQLLRDGLTAATPDACLAAFRAAWGEGKPRLFASGSLPAGTGPADLAKLAAESARKRVDPVKATIAGEFAYTNFGPPGRVVKRTHITELDIHCLEFANGVKLNLKATDFVPDNIRFSADFGTGQAGEPANKRGLRLLVSSGFGLLGLGKHTHDQLNHLSAGLIVSFGVGVGEDSFVASGVSDGAGAERWLQLLTATLVDPGWRKEDLGGIQQRVIFGLNKLSRETGPALSAHRSGRLVGNAPRYATPVLKEVLAYSLADLRQWIEPQLKSGPLEIGIVGDFDVEEMIELAASTVGCLPRRGPPPAVTPVKFADVLKPTPLVVNATTRNGAVQVTWPLLPASDHQARRREELLAKILENRLVARVREEMGATYSPQCGPWRSALQPASGYLIAALSCEPGDTKRVAETVREVADAFEKNPVTDDELARACQPMVEAHPAQLRSNAYWLAACVANAQTRPDRLTGPATRVPDLEATTSEELTQLATRILPSARASLFTAYPAEQKKP